jgi:hypothetical protein
MKPFSNKMGWDITKPDTGTKKGFYLTTKNTKHTKN